MTLRYCLLDMSGYVLSIHKNMCAAIKAQSAEWNKNKTKGMDVQPTPYMIRRGMNFYSINT